MALYFKYAFVLLCCFTFGAKSVNIPVEDDASYYTSDSIIANGYSIRGRTPRHEKIELVFAVKQQNLDQLEKILYSVSDPSNKDKYGKHLTNEQVHQLIKPSDTSVEAVTQFLQFNKVKITSTSINNDFITTVVPVATAEKLLNTRYYEFYHEETGLVVHRTKAYYLPESVSKAVDFVSPTVTLPNPRKKVARSKKQPNSLLNDPGILRKLYNVGNVQGSGSNGNKQAVTAFLEQKYSPSDLKEFQELFCGKNQTFKCTTPSGNVTTKGDQKGPGTGTESMLDIEYINGLSGNIDTEFWGFAGRSPDNKNNEPFLKWLMLVSNTTDTEVPHLFSTSYGEDEDLCSFNWAKRINAEFMKAGARGISLLFAAGDSGAAGDNGCAGGKKNVFVPQWPSGSPYVTAVGGTSGLGAETAIGLGSGGFSNRWARPSWQKSAVEIYKKSTKLPSNPFNATGRGFPDISAQAIDFVVVMLGIPLPGVSGTSCASPTAGGIFGLLNDIRYANNKPPLGFLNPLIYQNADAFNDITTGSNNGCNFNPGFPAAKGWDAATGVGTPNYLKLKSVVDNI